MVFVRKLRTSAYWEALTQVTVWVEAFVLDQPGFLSPRVQADSSHAKT